MGRKYKELGVVSPHSVDPHSVPGFNYCVEKQNTVDESVTIVEEGGSSKGDTPIV